MKKLVRFRVVQLVVLRRTVRELWFIQGTTAAPEGAACLVQSSDSFTRVWLNFFSSSRIIDVNHIEKGRSP